MRGIKYSVKGNSEASLENFRDCTLRNGDVRSNMVARFASDKVSLAFATKQTIKMSLNELFELSF